ncbi:MAG: transposase [Planctomycetes bacterium]|nr:transposase [Planctomycetota bacterium]
MLGTFSNEQIDIIAGAFTEVVSEQPYTCYACAIMPDHVHLVIRYVENNPIKQRMPGQNWPFVKTYDGWPLHPGHSRNSPYVKRMRGGKNPTMDVQ